METRRIRTLTLLCLGAAMLMVSVATGAQPRRRGIYGDWNVKMTFNERQMDSILSFSRDSEGNQTAHWISFWGMSELKDVKFEEGKLSFTQVFRNRDGQEMTSKFTGTIQEGKLTGTIASDRGSFKVEGTRGRRAPRAVGSWELKFTIGERDITTRIVVTADAERNLAVSWPSERIEHTISEVNYERGRLTFKSTSKMGDRQWASTFQGTIEGDTLTATLTSERGEVAVAGKRVGAPLIGTWNLELTSDRGTRKQRLRVNPDMSGLYGAMPIKKVNLEGGKVSFKVTRTFGERTFEMSFQGTVKESKLTGELTTSRGSQKVTGTKVVRRFRRRPAR